MEFEDSRSGHKALLDWAVSLGGDRVFAIEGSGGFGRALAPYLAAHCQEVVEVPPGLTTRERRRLRARGKSFPGEALAIARVAVRECGGSRLLNRHDHGMRTQIEWFK